MPIENERKFVLDDDGTLERTARANAGRDAGSLPAAGLSRCVGPAHPLDRGRPARCVMSSPTSARSTARWSRSRPTSRRSTSSACGRSRRETLAEGALLLGRRPLPLGRRLLQDRRRPHLFCPGRGRDAGRRHGAAAAARRAWRRTSCCWRRAAIRASPPSGWPTGPCRAPAGRHPREGRSGMKIARIDSHLGQGAVHLRRQSPATAAHLDDQQHPAGEGRDRHRHHRLGRSVLLRLHRRRAGGPASMVAPIAIGRDARDIARLSLRPAAEAASVRPLRHHDLRPVGPRHRAVGHRRQGGQPAAASPAGRRRADLAAGLCQPARSTAIPSASRRAPGSRSSEGYRHIKLHETEEAEVRAARDAAGHGVPIMVDTNCPWTPEQARHMTLKLRPYDLHWLEEPIFPPEDFAGDRAAARRHRRADGGGREQLHAVPVPRHVRRRRRRLRPAQRHQGGRRHGVPEGRDAGRCRRRHA